MILVKNWKLLLALVLDKIGQEIMFDDYLVRKQALLDHRKAVLQSDYIGFFSKGLTHDFGQNWEITSWFVFRQNRP